MLELDGPLLIACNHPNSFLDAIILTTLFKRPVYSLARGDVFKNKFYAKLLMSLKMFPVYRASEGVENLEQNYITFEKCRELFKHNGIVLIFSEGRCFNEWRLRPLMKGTARLAISSWQENIPLKILPTGINYSSFKSFGKNLQLNFGEAIVSADISKSETEAKNIQAFNCLLKTQLETLVVNIPNNNEEIASKVFHVRQPIVKKIFLFIPAVIGLVIHFPLYIPMKNFIWKRAAHSDHFDSLMVGILFFAYPIYLLLITLITFFITKQSWSFILILLIPFTAWSAVQLKKQS